MAQDDNSLSRPNLSCGRSQKNWSEQKEPRSRSTLIAGEKEQKVPLLLLSILHFLGWRREEISLVFWWRWRGRGEGAVRYIAKGGAGIEGVGGTSSSSLCLTVAVGGRPFPLPTTLLTQQQLTAAGGLRLSHRHFAAMAAATAVPPRPKKSD